MKNYVGCKIIKAEPTTYGEYKGIKNRLGKSVEATIPDETEGYIVVYPPLGQDKGKPYISWCPKGVFEVAYRPIDNSELYLMAEE